MVRRTLPLLLSVLLVGCAAAATELGWDMADDNDDELVSRAEWSDFMGQLNAFPNYDDDNDGVLSMAEYREAANVQIEGDAYFRGFDRDHSGTLTEQEFEDGVFNSYDRDGDGWLDEGQFESAVDGLAVEM